MKQKSGGRQRLLPDLSVLKYFAGQVAFSFYLYHIDENGQFYNIIKLAERNHIPRFTQDTEVLTRTFVITDLFTLTLMIKLPLLFGTSPD